MILEIGLLVAGATIALAIIALMRWLMSEPIKRKLVDFRIWLRHLGLLYAGITLVAVIIIGSAYLFAVSSQVTKLAVTLGCIIVYNLCGKVHSKIPEVNKKVRTMIAITILVADMLAIYGLILCAFFVWWPVTITIVLGLVLAIVLVVMNEKKIQIPVPLVWFKNIDTIFTYIALAYYLVHYLGYI